VRREAVVNVLQLISSEGYYGAESMLVALARALPEHGCGSIVGVFRDSRSPHTEVADEAQRLGVPVEIVPCRGRWDWNAVKHIRRLIATHSVDVLHSHGYKADLYAWAAAWPNRAMLTATSHNWPSKLFSMRQYAALDRLVLRMFDQVVAASDPVAERLLRSGIKPRKLATICNGVDVPRFQDAVPSLRRELGLSRGRLVGFVGRFVPDKGGALFFSAAQRVLLSHPDTTFVLVGDGPCRGEWEALAARLGLSSNVVFAGLRNDMPGVYASLDMLVLPSLNEATPMCLLEAMAAGVPVVATKVGSVPRLIIPDSTGVLLEPGDADAIGEAILRLLEDPDRARRLAEAGRSHVVRRFSAVAMAGTYVELYQEALARRDRRKRAGELRPAA
jgi:glycosyltransferase involved in cell wall biosynthesis